MNKFLLCFLLTIFSSSYAMTIKRASEIDIKMLLKAATKQSTISWITYIGETKKRLYIEYETMVHLSSLVGNKTPTTTIYWLPISKSTHKDILKIKSHLKTRDSNRLDPYTYIWKQKEGSTSGMVRFFYDLDSDGKKDLFLASKALIGNAGGDFNIFLKRKTLIKKLEK